MLDGELSDGLRRAFGAAKCAAMTDGLDILRRQDGGAAGWTVSTGLVPYPEAVAAMEARVADAPRANEIVVAIVVTDSGRPLARIGGLQASEIKGEDGLR